MEDQSRQSAGRILTRDPSSLQVVADRTDDGAYEISVRPTTEEVVDSPSSSADASDPQRDAGALPWKPVVAVIAGMVVIVGVGLAQRSPPQGSQAGAVAPVVESDDSSFRVYRVDPVQLQQPTRFVLGDRLGADEDAGESPDVPEPEPYEPGQEPGSQVLEPSEDFAPRDWSPPSPSRVERAAQPGGLRSPEAQSEALLRATMTGQLERVPVHVERILLEADFAEDDDFDEFDELDDLEEFDDDFP